MTLNDQPRITGGEPSRKLGVKYLDTEQMGNTFPDYQALLDRIEEHRQIADYAARLPGREHTAKRQPQMYDNVYAVLGGRGTGKSSVILTLCEWLKQDRNHQDLCKKQLNKEAQWFQKKQIKKQTNTEKIK